MRRKTNNPKTAKRRGIKFEQKVRKYLESMNWFVVRQASSAFPDLIAVPPWERTKRITNEWNFAPHKVHKTVKRSEPSIYAIECKKSRFYLTPKEKDDLEELEISHGLIPALAFEDEESGKLTVETLDERAFARPSSRVVGSLG